ncbi:MAG: helix-turn-helix domain-containing protein [Candidatus Limnocylindrales bacterium]
MSGSLTLPEAATILGLSPATLRSQIRYGRLRARKLGRDWIVTRSEIERYRTASLGHPGRRPTPG